MKPWVLEVNVLPSLSSSSPFDKRIKTMLVCDALTLVGMRGYNKSECHGDGKPIQGLAPFEQSMTLKYLLKKEGVFNGSELLTHDEMDMLIELEEEFSRRGNF